MKKILCTLLILAGISNVSAATCVDLTSVLSKGAENSRVLALQNFLFEKGYLKAKPNGYFGVGTVAAVKAYPSSRAIGDISVYAPTMRSK